MSVFISHSFRDVPEFENVTDALEHLEVPYWNPAEILPGASLREQLRSAVEQCRLCIFVATKNSVGSSWCGAELGAFWGAGKPVLVYLAEQSLTDEELPQVLQGDVWERRIVKIARRAKEIISQTSPLDDQSSTRRNSSISNMTVEQLEKMIFGAVSLAAATEKHNTSSPDFEHIGSAARNMAGKILAGFQASETVSKTLSDDWKNKILWVDDRPDNNVLERQAMEAMGIEFTLALSTNEALRILSSRRFAAIISDMGRREGPKEGYVLLQALRAYDTTTPFFIYAGSRAVEHQREAVMRGAQGTTNRANELVELITRVLPGEG